MSTELKTLKGKIEIPKRNGTMTSDYKEVDVSLTRFWGGTERKVSLQITFLNEQGNYSHIQLDNENVKLLFEELNNNFLEKK